MTVHVGLLLEADLESSAAASESVAALQAQLQQVTQDTGKHGNGHGMLKVITFSASGLWHVFG